MNIHRPRILAIDDTPSDLSMLGAALAGEFDLQTTTSGPLGLDLALQAPPDLILLDVMMPGMDGFETCQRFKTTPALKDIPLVFVTAVSEYDSEVLGLILGAADYITKPINVKIARQRIRNLLERENLRKQLEAQRDLLEERVAERDRAQTALEKANAALAARAEQAEGASAARAHFLSRVSHELRTPLHTILGYVRLLRKDANGEAHRQLVIVERSSTQLLKLIDDLLDFNLEGQQAEELQPDAVELPPFFAHLEHTVRLLARQGNNRFTLALADDLPAAVWVDEQRLLQILQNLLVNACKFTHDGTISLSVIREDETLQGAERKIPENCRLCFAIEDSGSGISVEDRERIFEAFSRGASAYRQPGLGLGLAIARQWARAMGSEIRVHSEPGQGSRFFFTLELPVASSAPLAPFAASESFREWLASTPCRVLVVDDIAENRLLLRDLCERRGFTVVEAADGQQALAACLTTEPPFAAALIDQFMPGMDGWELLRRIRQIPALAPLVTVLISASAGQKPANFPDDIDFDHVLCKPLDEQALIGFLYRSLSTMEQTAAFCALANTPSPSSSYSFSPSFPEPIPLPPLPADELASFRELLDLGRVVKIEDWVQALAAKNPAYSDLAQRIVPHCRAGNLPELEKLATAAQQS
jgi:signal transduction histidine kinase